MISGDNMVSLSLNKRLAAPIPGSPADFEILVDDIAVQIQDVQLDLNNQKVITFTVDHIFKAGEVVKISYGGMDILAEDGTALNMFTLRDVTNTIALIHEIPGRIEAEEFFFQSGVELENTTDAGGGQNVAHLDAGDYLDYYIDVPKTTSYIVDYRTAALSETGKIILQLINENDDAVNLHGVSFAPTGGWQNWITTSKTAILTEGVHHLRLLVDQPMFNLNWFEISLPTSSESPAQNAEFRVSPNPGGPLFYLEGELQTPRDLMLQVHDTLGRSVRTASFIHVSHVSETIDLSGLPSGEYILTVKTAERILYSGKLLYQKD
jgi:hypothetical protein